MTETVLFGMCTKDEDDVIRETIRTIRMQTRVPDYIYICDASNDETPDIIRDELDGSEINLELFQQKRYNGHGGGRQELYERAKEQDPDVFCMLDANHTVDEWWLENLLKFWTSNPEYDALTGPDCSQNVDYEVDSPHNPLYYRHAAIAFDFDFLQGVGGWDPDFGRGEDWDLAIRIYRAGADVYTSSRWCSRKVTSSPSGLMRERIAGNPTSVPYLAKYGRWYATFHPGQVLKDIGSLFFYVLALSTIVMVASGFAFGGILGVLTVLYATSYVLGISLYTGGIDRSGFRRSTYLLVYTAPAVLNSTRDVLGGRYRTSD